MEWYYTSGSEPIGPVDEAALKELKTEGKIAYETMVWRHGMADWQPYGRAIEAPGPPLGPPGSPEFGRHAGVDAREALPTYLKRNIFNLLLSLVFCLMAGLGLVTVIIASIGLINAIAVRSHLTGGQYPRAQCASRRARRFWVLALVINIIFTLFAGFIIILMMYL